MSETLDRARDDLAKIEEAFRGLAKKACEPGLSLQQGRELKALAGRLRGQMKALRKKVGLPVSGAWAERLGRGPEL